MLSQLNTRELEEKTVQEAGARVEETFPKYELVGTHAGRIAEKTKADAMKLIENAWGM